MKKTTKSLTTKSNHDHGNYHAAYHDYKDDDAEVDYNNHHHYDYDETDDHHHFNDNYEENNYDKKDNNHAIYMCQWAILSRCQ